MRQQDQILLYLLMRPQRNSKLKLMQQCLCQFRQIPLLLQTLTKKQSNHNNKIKQLIDCSNKFADLAQQSQQLEDNESVLYYRFFSRIREIINASITYYLHTCSFVMIRQLLTQVNTQILEYKPKAGYPDLLLSISSIIRRFATKLANTKPFAQEILDQLSQIQRTYKLTQQQSEQIFSSTQPNYYYKYMQKKIRMKQQLQNTEDKDQKILWMERLQKSKIKSKSKQELKNQENYALTKSMGLNAVSDIDSGYISMLLQNNHNSQQTFRQSINRNRNISYIMKRYQQRYNAYKSRPAHRQNRQRSDYQPTTYPYFVKNSRSKTRIKKVASQNQSRTKIKSIMQYNFFQAHEQVKKNENILKQQFLNQIASYRQKYQLRRVTIGINNMNMNNDSKMLNHTVQYNMRNSKKKNTNADVKQRTKTYSNRSYISKITSLPLKGGL